MPKFFRTKPTKQNDPDTDSDEHYAAAAAEATEDPFANLLSLKLRKPKHWNWELTTSRSCSNIALPRILLYDHNGALLVDADTQQEQSYKSPQAYTEQRRRRSATRKRAATANLDQTLRQALHSDFHGLQIAEATPTQTPSNTPTRSPSRQPAYSGSCIDFSTHELPDYEQQSLTPERRSSSLRGVRFQEQLGYPTPPSTSTLTTTANSSSSGPREKRRYKRSQSSGRSTGGSILERFSMSKGRHSSPEYAVEQHIQHAPRYYLRSSKAGTLVIQDDSFSRVRQRRRRPRFSSSENMLNESGRSGRSSRTASSCAPAAMTLPAMSVPQQARQATSVAQTRRRACSIRRHKTETLPLSTSEEEELALKQTRGRRLQRNCGKDVAQELITLDPKSYVYHSTPGATAR